MFQASQSNSRVIECRQEYLSPEVLVVRVVDQIVEVFAGFRQSCYSTWKTSVCEVSKHLLYDFLRDCEDGGRQHLYGWCHPEFANRGRDQGALISNPAVCPYLDI